MATQIPTFPKFKKLSIEDGAYVRRFSRRFQPYSLLNFSSLWAWNTEGKCEISKLNGNLVMLYTDFITSKPFITILGTKKADDTVTTLITYIQKKGGSIPIRFVTEETKSCLSHTIFHITEDRNNFDYIFSTSKLAHSEGPDYKQKRQLIHKFTRENPNARFVQDNLNDDSVRKNIIAVIRRWERNKKDRCKLCDLKHEEEAIMRLLKYDSNRKFVLSCVYLGDTMIGFSIDEILGGGFAMAHFIKADYSFKGISEYINEKVAQHLLEQGVKLWNWQQDLNFDGLRKLKMSYCPVHFLKTYSISKK